MTLLLPGSAQGRVLKLPSLSLWGATTPEPSEPPEGAEPYRPGTGDDVPWELRD